MEEVVVGISDAKVIKNSGVLSTYALSSCVATCIYDNLMKIGGMSHILLPKAPNNMLKLHSEVFKYADTAIFELVKKMELMGSSTYRMKAKIVGGAHMYSVFKSGVTNIGNKNVESVRTVLKHLNIAIISDDIGKNYARSVFFDVNNGSVKVKIANKTEIFI